MKALVLALFMAVGVVLASPEVAWAQGADLFDEQACRENPHSEHCICATVRKFNLYPRSFDATGNPEDLDSSGNPVSPPVSPPVQDPVTGLWEGDPEDLELFVSDQYAQQCSLSYFRENLRRAWYFVAALGAGFAAISMTWAGVVYMQESSSGGDLSRARGMMVRVMVGLVLLTCALLVWEGLNGFLLDHVESWTLDRNIFYQGW